MRWNRTVQTLKERHRICQYLVFISMLFVPNGIESTGNNSFESIIIKAPVHQTFGNSLYDMIVDTLKDISLLYC